jgi:DHA3 family macrolide efflux protein-like MFS transporter
MEKLTRVNGINSVISSVTLLLSPAVGALLLGSAGFAYALLFDVVTAIIAVIVLSFLQVEAIVKSEKAASTIKELISGIRYIREHILIKYLLIFYALFFFLITPAAFLTPLLVERRLMANELSWTIGSVLGGIFISIRGGFKNRIYTMAVACLAFGITFALLGVANNFILYLTIMLISGIFMPIFSTSEIVLIQENVEELMLGRVFSIIQIIASVTMPLGMVIFGPIADIIKIEYLMIGTGIFLSFLALYIFSNKTILCMDEGNK